MSRAIRLYVSSSPDLAMEREAVGQAVAELPVSTGWEIKHTPGAGEIAHEALEFVERCDLYLLVLGADFAAPMGLEWRRAAHADRVVLAYRKRVLHSPSAQELLRRSWVAWTAFESPSELKERITLALAQAVLDRGEQFGLHLDDVEGLLALLSPESGPHDDERGATADRRRGAERGGVILGRGT